MRSESQRRADAAYKRRNAEKIASTEKVLSVRVSAQTAEELKAACAEQGTTVNAVLNAAVKDFLKK